MTLTKVAGTELPTVPWLPATLRRTWRAPGSLQIGVDPDRAVVLHQVTGDVATFIGGLDGTRDLQSVLDDCSLAREHCSDIIATLAQAGLLVDLADAADGPPSPAHHPRLAGTLAPEIHGRVLGRLAASPTQTLQLRSRALVVIVGGTRLTSALASTLVASGIRRIGLVQPGTIGNADLMPGGPSPADLGRQRYAALREAITRASPSAIVTIPSTSDRPDLVVLADPVDPRGDRVRMLMRSGTPILALSIRERRGVVGPFVIPGDSSCLECQDAVRRDLDPAWAAVRSQLLAYPHPAGDGGETPLVLMTAALAATQILQWVDGERLPETINATLEIALPELVLERRYWPRHDACSCRIS